MPAKKKQAKEAAKKTTAFDAALEPPAAKAVVEVTPEVRRAVEHLASLEPRLTPEGREEIQQAAHDEGGEPWPNYSPFPEEENEGPGFSPANVQPATTDTDAVEASFEAPAADEPVLGSGSPVEPLESLSGLDVPQDASKTVTDLIDACNYLYTMAKTIRGPRGLKQHDESILRKRVAKGRELLAGLK